jgi:predicted methyltransferase MtxX (methanogen marker protein 4)
MSEVDALEVYLFRPNPDALPPDVEKEVFADLDANGIGEELTITKRSKLKSIQISPTRKKYIRVAARNGFVHASGRSDLGKKEKIATDEHPLEHTQTMIRKEGTEAEEANLFVQHCIRMYERIVKAIGGTDGRKKKANRKE